MGKGEPTLAALKAFEATVRCQSMTQAANELGTTQPAISQRLCNLEAALGVTLLDRAHRGSKTTPSGREFYDNIAEALGMLREATQQLQARAERYNNDIRIGAHFGFAHQWLLPRFEALQTAFPNIRFEVIPVDQNASDEMTDADIKITFATINTCESSDRLLMTECVYPVCSPGFAARHGLQTALSMSREDDLPLLHMDQNDARWLDWPRWLDLAGLTKRVQPPGFYYRNYPLMLNAATRGEGVALGWHDLVTDLIDNGSLIALEPEVQRGERGYIISSPHAHNPVVRHVIDWLVDNASSKSG